MRPHQGACCVNVCAASATLGDVIDAALVRTAHGDAWQQHGLLRTDAGGAVGEATGLRMMASGLPHPQWNNADVHDPDRADIAALDAWYAERAVPWGMRVPAGAAWNHGRLLFRKRLMVLEPDTFRSAPGSLTIEAVTVDRLDEVVTIDALAFEGDPTPEWMAPLLHSEQVTVAVVHLADEPVATGYLLRSDGWAGHTALLAGIAVLPSARRRGIGGQLSSWLVARAFDAGARFVHLNPDTDEAARLYGRLGFVEVDGFDVYLAPGVD